MIKVGFVFYLMINIYFFQVGFKYYLTLLNIKKLFFNIE